MLLAALGLVVIPLIGGLGLLDGRLVLEEPGFRLCEAAHVPENRADGRDDRGHNSELTRQAPRIVLSCVFQLVIMRAVDMKAVIRHFNFLRRELYRNR